jgi:hypothetical protein
LEINQGKGFCLAEIRIVHRLRMKVLS